MKETYLNKEKAPCTIKELLKKQGVSSTNWRKWKREATFFLEQQQVEFNTTIKPEQTLTVEYTPINTIAPEYHPLDIVYEDDFLLAINKPADLLVHPTTSKASGTLANFVTHYFQQKNLDYSYHPVSRLDRDTSGLVLLAKTTRIHNLLSKTHIEKTYLALLNGILPAQQGLINLPIGRNPTSIIERKVALDGKPALTYYKLLKNYQNKVSLVQLKLLTGRTHQIRIHTKHLNCPIYADSLYDKHIENSRQFLHAQSIEFTHPITQNTLKLTTRLPADLKQAIRKFL